MGARSVMTSSWVGTPMEATISKAATAASRRPPRRRAATATERHAQRVHHQNSTERAVCVEADRVDQRAPVEVARAVEDAERRPDPDRVAPVAHEAVADVRGSR